MAAYFGYIFLNVFAIVHKFKIIPNFTKQSCKMRSEEGRDEKIATKVNFKTRYVVIYVFLIRFGTTHIIVSVSQAKSCATCNCIFFKDL